MTPNNTVRGASWGGIGTREATMATEFEENILIRIHFFVLHFL